MTSPIADVTDVGYTGARCGPSGRQQSVLWWLLDQLNRTNESVRLHHGDCVGSDDCAHHLARSLGIAIVIHPPDDDKARAWCGHPAEVAGILTKPPKPYLVRNHDIVNETQLLIAVPRTLTEELRSGTWATIRYARTTNKPIIILDP